MTQTGARDRHTVIWQIPRRAFVRGAATAAAALIAGGLDAPLRAAPADDRLTFRGPIPVTATSKPWGTAMDSGPREAAVRLYSYVEEEYFLSGVANVYGPENGSSPSPGQSTFDFALQMKPLARLMRPNIPFVTRAIMLRPDAMTKFSGVVHLIPLHNLDGTTYIEPNLLRNGDVWIGLEVCGGTRFGVEERPSGGIANLLSYDARRYAGLSVPAGRPEDWPDLQGGKLGQAFKTINFGQPESNTHTIFRQEISRSYAQAPDIMTKMSEALRNDAPGNPLHGHQVRRIYTAGRSGQSTILAPYIEFHHEAARRRLGHVPFDGYMIRVGTFPATRPTGSVLVIVQSEAEVEDLPQALVAKMVDTDDPMFRYYEIPGVGHGLTARPNVSGRIGQVVPEGVQGISDIEGHTAFRPYDKVNLPVIWGMWRNIYAWLDDGVPMPRADRIARDPKAKDGIARDRFGNAEGGLRLPWMDVPDAHYVGVISEKNPLEGGMQPFGETQMIELYGSREAYLAKIDQRLAQMAKDRWIDARDIPLMRKRGVSPALAIGLPDYAGDAQGALSPTL